jgi:hypothetical protein
MEIAGAGPVPAKSLQLRRDSEEFGHRGRGFAPAEPIAAWQPQAASLMEMGPP